RVVCLFFFFQAEDGIRDGHVTGVQTCALPIEKQKRELEELSRKQEELERGRAEITDKLTRSLVILEREAYDAQKRLEQVRAMRESFGQHLELIEAIDPKSWNPADLHKELSRALST